MGENVDIDALIQNIYKVFSDAVYPGNDNLVVESYGDEPKLVKNHFAGRSDWTKLTHTSIDVDGALAYFSDRAFRFYIPAFMIADVNKNLNLNDPAIRLCWHVTPQSENGRIAKVWGGETMGDRAKKCFENFTDEQAEVIVSYLQWKQSQDDSDDMIKQALENYWLQRTKNPG